jgi:hypothetical protein
LTAPVRTNKKHQGIETTSAFLMARPSVTFATCEGQYSTENQRNWPGAVRHPVK